MKEFVGTDNDQFTGVFVPAKIWLDTELTVLQRVILIDMLSYTCYAKTTREMAEFFGVTPGKVKEAVLDLIDKGKLEVNIAQEHPQRGGNA